MHLIFMFMGDEKSEKTLAMLVVEERATKAVMGCVAPEVEWRMASKEGGGVHEGVWV